MVRKRGYGSRAVAIVAGEKGNVLHSAERIVLSGRYNRPSAHKRQEVLLVILNL